MKSFKQSRLTIGGAAVAGHIFEPSPGYFSPSSDPFTQSKVYHYLIATVKMLSIPLPGF